MGGASRPLRLLATVLGLAGAMLGVLASESSGRVAEPRRTAAGCADPDALRAARDRSNPLALAAPPGPNPLTGARLFVNGPAHGAAARAIATLVGLDPRLLPDDESWAGFLGLLERGPLAARLASDPALATQVRLLAKIASQPETNRFSLYSGGGGPGAIYGQVHQFLCRTMAADPGSVAVLSTYFLYQAGYCETRSEIVAHRPTFERQVNELARGIDRHPVVLLLEPDAIGASACTRRLGSLTDWEADIRYEVNTLGALPHAVAYVEAGYADGNSPRYTAAVLRAANVGRIRGFFTNDTHEDWTIDEIRWAQRVSRLTGGAHFVVNTATNGHGPLVAHERVRHGNEVLCNPAGRGVGPLPTTSPSDPRTHAPFAGLDAFLWAGVPGNSSGPCNGGPAAGSFWVTRALELSASANGQLGPAWPSEPY